ncbi:MAG: OFA family MFS transporter [Acidobacteria bacterium]|nr:OFA family MFS transporter [Acidobacteriota bacterium]
MWVLSGLSLPRTLRGRVLLAAALLALGAFYVLGATEHARVMNTARARADQSGYLWDAVAMHRNWQGTQDELIGERNRMPLYPGFLALSYDPALSPDEFFERAKQLNIRLSLVLLLVIALVAHWRLPTAWASAFTLVVAFGYFIFKAGYAQSELLFYTLLFLAFLAQAHLLRGGMQRRDAVVALLGGVLAALAHLTKAAALPLVGLFAGVFFVTEIGFFFADPAPTPDRVMPSRTTRVLRRGGLLVLFLGAFLLTLYPYIANSHRVFGPLLLQREHDVLHLVRRLAGRQHRHVSARRRGGLARSAPRSAAEHGALLARAFGRPGRRAPPGRAARHGGRHLPALLDCQVPRALPRHRTRPRPLGPTRTA